ncbi:MAG: dihydropyrimidinase [Deltaproteobacteria bacterium]|nr:dihydropyrimidinase [Deltaproteobacteria bacterium]
MKNILIKNGVIVTETETFEGDLMVSQNVISRIGTDLEVSGDAAVIDAGGKYVLPGGVDVHTHLNLTVGETRVGDGFFQGTAAAAHGGTTCVVEHPGFGPPGCSVKHQVAVYQADAAGQAVVDYGLHAVLQHLEAPLPLDLDELGPMGVPSVKIYLTYDGRLNDGEILSVLNRTRKLGLLAVFHAENHAIIQFLQDRFKQRGKAAPRYYAMSRPDFCETEAIQRVLHLARAAGDVPVYFAHLSTAEGLDIIERARRRGQPAYAEVCPQHLLLDVSCYDPPDVEGLKYVMAPPARRTEDREALWQGLQNGSIQVVGSDHCAFTWADKLRLGRDDFSRCPGGIPGVETRLPLMFSEGVLKGRLSLNRFAALVATEPARIMGLYPKKGSLIPGADADLVIFDPDQEKVITPDILHDAGGYSPYEGMTVCGWPMLTMVRGKVVMDRGRLTAGKGWGRFVSRQLV